MHILNNTMSRYHCTKCNKESIMRNGDATTKVVCCDGDNPVEHKLGKAPRKATVVPTPEVPVKPVAAVPTPQTKLDQPLSGVKAKVN